MAICIAKRKPRVEYSQISNPRLSMSALLLHRYCTENGEFDSDNSSSGEYGYSAHGGAQQASG